MFITGGSNSGFSRSMISFGASSFTGNFLINDWLAAINSRTANGSNTTINSMITHLTADAVLTFSVQPMSTASAAMYLIGPTSASMASCSANNGCLSSISFNILACDCAILCSAASVLWLLFPVISLISLSMRARSSFWASLTCNPFLTLSPFRNPVPCEVYASTSLSNCFSLSLSCSSLTVLVVPCPNALSMTSCCLFIIDSSVLICVLMIAICCCLDPAANSDSRCAFDRKPKIPMDVIMLSIMTATNRYVFNMKLVCFQCLYSQDAVISLPTSSTVPMTTTGQNAPTNMVASPITE